MALLTIFVDQDNTLLYAPWNNIFVRPHAAEFIRLLKTLTPDVNVFTAGPVKPQSEIMKATGLYDLFENYYGAESEIPPFDMGILIDNNPDGMGKMEYLQQLAAGPVVAVPVEPFYGIPDDGLIRAARTVLGVANAMSRAAV